MCSSTSITVAVVVQPSRRNSRPVYRRLRAIGAAAMTISSGICGGVACHRSFSASANASVTAAETADGLGSASTTKATVHRASVASGQNTVAVPPESAMVWTRSGSWWRSAASSVAGACLVEIVSSTLR